MVHSKKCIRIQPDVGAAVIAVGAALIENFSWVFCIFGALFLVLAYRQAFSSHKSNPG